MSTKGDMLRYNGEAPPSPGNVGIALCGMCRHPVTQAVQALVRAVSLYEACHGGSGKKQAAGQAGDADAQLRDACDGVRSAMDLNEAGALAEAMTGSDSDPDLHPNLNRTLDLSPTLDL